MPSEQTPDGKSLVDHDKFGFLAYTLKKSNELSPMFTTTRTQSFRIPVLTDHGADGYRKEEITACDASGSDIASSNALGK